MAILTGRHSLFALLSEQRKYTAKKAVNHPAAHDIKQDGKFQFSKIGLFHSAVMTSAYNVGKRKFTDVRDVG